MKLNLDDYSMKVKNNIKLHGKFINRELSWLAFNARCLYYAQDKKVPLNERLNFLAITGSNLDEFLSVRFAYAYSNQEEEPYKDILHQIKEFKKLQNNAYEELKKDLEKEKLKISDIKSLSKKERDKIYDEYITNIFPLLTPVNLTMKMNNSFISSGMLCIAVGVGVGDNISVSIIPIPDSIDLVYEINGKIIYTEDIIKYFLKDTLFINKPIASTGTFVIIKDGSVILSHDPSKFLIDRMEETIMKRDGSNPVFMDIDSKMDDHLQDMIINLFQIPKGHIYRNSHLLRYRRFSHPILPTEKYSYKPFAPVQYENKEGFYSLFDALNDHDILLHHPYDSYETVVRFVQHAAEDKDVVAIKQTLYRVSSEDSPIVKALCKAAKNGKQVSVLIEVKARFDETNNIRLIKKLQNAGANVLLGKEFLKTHCKVCIVVRKENDELKIYSHVGTGNYNEKTAKIYSDLSYLTSKQKLGYDLLYIFNILSGHSRPDEKLQKIAYSPVNLRKTLLKCISREIDNAKKGKKAEIFIKINSLSDVIMVNALYDAADAGVKVYIICRGICSITPRKNLYIKSIVGRFLEHSRIYYFKNDKNPEYYISSADLLTRNLDRRVETLISLKDSTVVDQIKWIIRVFKADESNSFVMTEKGKWAHLNGKFDCQQWFIDHSDSKKEKKNWK